MSTTENVIGDGGNTAFPIAVFDEFGKSIDDAVQDHVDAHLDRLRTRIAALVEAAVVVVVCNQRMTLTDREVYLLEHALKEFGHG